MTAGRIQRARRLRRDMSPPEVRLWLRLKGRKTGAPHFRRQHPLGPYVLDFFCGAARLVVEVDGWGHNMGDQPERDERRDAWLTDRGLMVVRILAADVMRDADEAADGLMRLAVSRAPSPLPRSGGGGAAP